MEAPESIEKKDHFQNGVLTVIGSFILHLFLGSIYLWGNINVYITSYLHSVDQNVTLENTNIVFALEYITASVFIPIGLFLARLISIKNCIIFGSLLNIASVFVSSFIRQGTTFELVYACGTGVGLG